MNVSERRAHSTRQRVVVLTFEDAGQAEAFDAVTPDAFAELIVAMLREPWRWDDADERFDGGAA